MYSTRKIQSPSERLVLGCEKPTHDHVLLEREITQPRPCLFEIPSRRSSRVSVMPEALAPCLEGRALGPDGDDPGPRLLRVGAALDGHSQRGVAHLQDAHPVHASRLRRRRRGRRRRWRRRQWVRGGGRGGGAAAVRRPGRRLGLEESVELNQGALTVLVGNFISTGVTFAHFFIVRNCLTYPTKQVTLAIIFTCGEARRSTCPLWPPPLKLIF